MSFAFSVRSLSKIYQMGEEEVKALDSVDLNVPAGDYVAIMGPSGSGKSTLLNLLGCLDRATEGFYEVNGCEVTQLSDNELSQVRGQSIGFVFQSYNLIPYLNVLENIRMPRAYLRGDNDSLSEAKELAERVGLGRSFKITARRNFRADNNNGLALPVRYLVIPPFYWLMNRLEIWIVRRPKKSFVYWIS